MYRLSDKDWIDFDLDNTLQDYHGASQSAIDAVSYYLAERHAMVVEHVSAMYRAVLVKLAHHYFIDGRTAVEYRQERFTALLRQLNLPVTQDTLTSLLSLYDKTLQTALVLTEGARGLLQQLKARNKSVVVISEGPQDAQVATIKQLGIAPLIDSVVTSNVKGLSKTDGLVMAVVNEFNIDPNRFIYIGDSLVRDVMPLVDAGIDVIHYDAGATMLHHSAYTTVRSLLDILQ